MGHSTQAELVDQRIPEQLLSSNRPQKRRRMLGERGSGQAPHVVVFTLRIGGTAVTTAAQDPPSNPAELALATGARGGTGGGVAGQVDQAGQAILSQS